MLNYLSLGSDYAVYRAVLDEMAHEGKTSGAEQNESFIAYTKINQARMNRLEKSVELTDDLRETAQNLDVKWVWLILTETWCGDAAQNLPIIEKIAQLNDGIQTVYLFRDENLELMDKYAVNGARAIPKLICIDAHNGTEIGTWGSRPQAAKDYFQQMKDEGLDKSVIGENIQRWYIQDKTQSLQKEFLELLKIWAQKDKNFSRQSA